MVMIIVLDIVMWLESKPQIKPLKNVKKIADFFQLDVDEE